MLKNTLTLILLSVSLFAAQVALVETSVLKKGEVNPLQEFVGTLSFEKKSVLAAQNSGLVKKINFKVGQKVKKNKILIQIDADVLNAQIKASKASLKTSKDEEVNSSKDYNRYKALLDSKSITQKEYDDALLKSNSSSNNVMVKTSSLKELELQSSKKSIKAPYDGIIVKKSINLGEWVNAGTPLATIVNINKADIVFNIPLSFVKGLNIGENYDITLDKKPIKAKLVAVIPNGDKLTRTFPVRFSAKIKDIFVFDGQSAKVSLAKNAKTNAFMLQRDSVIKRFNQNVIFYINEESKAMMIPVQIIAYAGSKVAIKAKGLVEGMNVVSKGNERIFPNQTVKIINK